MAPAVLLRSRYGEPHCFVQKGSVPHRNLPRFPGRASNDPNPNPLVSPFHCMDYLLGSVTESRCVMFECVNGRYITTSGMAGVESIGVNAHAAA